MKRLILLLLVLMAGVGVASAGVSENASLLITGNGTSFVDSSPYANTVLKYGNVTNNAGVYYNASIFDGISGSNLTIANPSINNNKWAVAGWANLSGNTLYRQPIIVVGETGDAFKIYFGTNSLNQTFLSMRNSASQTVSMMMGGALPANTWNYFYCEYNGTYMNAWVNGTYYGNSTLPNYTPSVASNRTTLGYGFNTFSWGTRSLSGGLDDILVTTTLFQGNIIPDTEFISNPTPGFTKNVSYGFYPLVVKFTNTSIGNVNISTYKYFGNNVTGNNTEIILSSSDSPTIIFGGSGNWSIKQQVSNPFGIRNSSIQWVNVSSGSPVSMFTPTTPTIWYPNGIAFTDISTDNPISWNWSFGDGNLSSLQNPTYAWVAPGTYTVELNASNAYGYSTNSTTVTVLPPIVSASFTQSNYGGQVPISTQFTYTGANATAWNWSYQNLTVPSRTYASTAQNPLLTFSQIGNYSIWLNVTGTGGFGSASATSWVNATNTTYSSITKPNLITIGSLPAPTVSYTINKTYTYTPSLDVAFNFTGTNPNAISYLWDFGDGGTASTANAIHSYSDYGQYTVSLTATNANASVTNTTVHAVILSNAAVVLSKANISTQMTGVETLALNNIYHVDSMAFNLSYNKTALSLQSIALNASSSGLSLSNTIDGATGNATIGLSGIDKSILSETSIVDLTWKVLDETNHTSYVVISPYVNSTWLRANSSYIPVSTYMPFVGVTNGSISTPNATYTKVLTFKNVYSQNVISGITVSIDYTGIISGSATTNDGTLTLTSTYGNTSLTSKADGYYNGSATVYFTNNDPQEILMSPLTGAPNQWTIYTPMQVKLVAMDTSTAAPIQGLYVTATPLNFSAPTGWTQILIGIQPSVNISGTTLDGYTGVDGSFIAPMLSSFNYRFTFVNLSQNVSYTSQFYPVNSEYRIWIQTAAAVNNTLSQTLGTNLTFTEPNSSYVTMGMNYVDSSSLTQNVTFIVYDQTNQTAVYTQTQSVSGSTSQFTSSYTIQNVRGGEYVWKFIAYRSDGSTVSQGNALTMKGPNGVMVDLGLPDVSWYRWISMCIFFLMASMASQRTKQFWGLLIPIFAAMFMWFGWFTGTASTAGIITLCVVIGAILYMKSSLREKYGVGGPGTLVLNIAIYLLLLQACVGFINGLNMWSDAGFGNQAVTVYNQWTNVQITQISTLQGTGGLDVSVLSAATLMWDLAIAALKVFISIIFSIVTIYPTVQLLFPWMLTSAPTIAFLTLLQLGLWILYAKFIYDTYWKPTPGTSEF